MTTAIVTRTYRLRAETLKSLNECSARTGIAPSELVDALLAHALAAERQGELTIARRPATWKLERVSAK